MKSAIPTLPSIIIIKDGDSFFAENIRTHFVPKINIPIPKRIDAIYEGKNISRERFEYFKRIALKVH
jgi:hypothetical protein